MIKQVIEGITYRGGKEIVTRTGPKTKISDWVFRFSSQCEGGVRLTIEPLQQVEEDNQSDLETGIREIVRDELRGLVSTALDRSKL